MATLSEQVQSTKVVTGIVRLSYCHLWEPTSVEEGGDKKYSVSIIIPKSDKDTLSRIKKGIAAAKEAGKSKWGGKIPAKIKEPLRDGDEDRPDDENYTDSYFINVTCKNKPGIVDKNLNPIINQDELYSGCFGRVSMNFYPFDTKGNKGIAAGLNNVQKIKDGDALGGRSKAEDDFAEPVEDDDNDLL